MTSTVLFILGIAAAIPKMELLGGIEGKRESNASPECGKTEGLC